MTVGSQMPELTRGGFLPPPPAPYQIGSQNIPYKLGLMLREPLPISSSDSKYPLQFKN